MVATESVHPKYESPEVAVHFQGPDGEDVTGDRAGWCLAVGAGGGTERAGGGGMGEGVGEGERGQSRGPAPQGRGAKKKEAEPQPTPETQNPTSSFKTGLSQFPPPPVKAAWVWCAFPVPNP